MGVGGEGAFILKMSQLKIIAFFSRSNKITCLFMFSFILVGLIDSCLYLKRMAQSNDRPHSIKQKNVTRNAFWGGYASAILSFLVGDDCHEQSNRVL